jgi:hypothetical protein
MKRIGYLKLVKTAEERRQNYANWIFKFYVDSVERLQNEERLEDRAGLVMRALFERMARGREEPKEKEPVIQ